MSRKPQELESDLGSPTAPNLHETNLAPTTSASYASYWKDFERWCQRANVSPLPASVDSVRAFLLDRAPALSESTLYGRVAAIRAFHHQNGLPSPTDDPAVLLSDILEAKSKALFRLPERPPIDLAEVVGPDRRMMIPLEPVSLTDLRDRLLFVLLAALDVPKTVICEMRRDWLSCQYERLSVRIDAVLNDTPLRMSVTIVSSDQALRPCTAASEWFRRAGISEGTALRPISKAGRVLDRPLSSIGLTQIVRSRAIAAGLDPSLHTPMQWRPIPRKQR